MPCQQVQPQLNALCDGERLSPGELYQVGQHCLGCTACRATWRQLRQLRDLFQTLPAPSVPVRLTEAVPVVLPLSAPPAPAIVPARRPAVRARVGVAGVVALLLIGLTAIPWRRDQRVGAAVEAAVKGANTWHLKGWKRRDGQRVPWEIWGRRTPFFYREQIGDELNFDDGTQRVRFVATGTAGRRVALRLASGPAPSDQWREWLTMGAGWRNFHVLRETRNEIWLAGGFDSGMQGPYSVTRPYFRVDKRTWLPVQWEYRLNWSNSNAPEQVTDTLQAEYDVPVPARVATLRLPKGVRLMDALDTPADASVPTENVQRAQGLTVQTQALAMDPAGNILLRVRSWLGNMKLGADGTGSFNDVETEIRYRTVNLLEPPPATVETGYRTDDGRVYVPFRLPRLELTLANGDVLMMLAPIEPRPAGAALPRSLTVELAVCPGVATQEGRMLRSSPLFSRDFTWTLPLPDVAAPIRIDDYLPPGHRDRVHYLPGADASTVEANIAQARADAYGMARRYERALYWQQQGLAAVPPFSNDAQFRRLAIASVYMEAGDAAHSAAMCREVIRISREHPETWNLYAHQAKGRLDYLHRHRVFRH